jgi:hypothetical protein
LTVPEIRHLLWALSGSDAQRFADVLDWSQWRRRHQARARRCQYARRLAWTADQLQL